MITIATPAKIAKTGSVYSPFVTASPRPAPPISPAITTIESAKRMVWLTESNIIRRASGICTFDSTCHRVAPSAVAASTVLGMTPRIPRAVIRIAGGTA